MCVRGCAVGVAHVLETAVANPSLLFGDAPLRLWFPQSVGVGQVLTFTPSESFRAPPGVVDSPPRESSARGVGNIRANVGLSDAPADRLRLIRPDPESITVGVGNNFFLACDPPSSGWPPFGWNTGVGHDENPVPLVRGADGQRRYAIPFRIKPALVNLGENVSESSTNESCHVLQDDNARSYQANESHEIKEQSRSFASNPDTLSCDADVLARESPDDGVDTRRLLVHLAHVLVPLNVRPMPREYGSRIGVDLALPRAAPTGALEAEVESTDTGEHGAERRMVHETTAAMTIAAKTSIGKMRTHSGKASSGCGMQP